MILAILIGSYVGNIPEKFELHLPKGLGGDLKKIIQGFFSIFSSGGHLVHKSGTI